MKLLTAQRKYLKNFLKNIYIQPTNFFLFHVILFGLLIAVFVPPLSGADEDMHLERAYQISTGQLVVQKIGNTWGGNIPSSFVQTFHNIRYLKGDSNRKYGLSITHLLVKIPLNENIKTPTNFIITAPYSAFAYAPQAIGVLVGRILNLPVVLIMYLARICGLLFYILCGYFALRILPQKRWLYALLLCLPMAMFSVSTESADSVVLGTTIVIIAMTIAAMNNKSIISKSYFVPALIMASIALATSKQVYILLALMPAILLISKNKISDNVHRKKILIVLLLVAVCWLSWVGFVQHWNLPPRPDPHAISSKSVVKNIAKNPLQFSAIVLNTFPTYNSNPLVMEFVGVFAWEDTPMPLWSIIGFYIIIALYALKNDHAKPILNKKDRKMIAVSGLLTVFIITIALYLNWTLPTQTFVDGLQGRYFLSVALFLVAALPIGTIIFNTSSFLRCYTGLVLVAIVVIFYRFYILPSPFVHYIPEPRKYIEQVRY